MYLRIVTVPAVSALIALSVTSAEAGPRYYGGHHHHHSSGAGVGVALGAGLLIGALAVTAAQPREEVYVYDAPPPPPRPYAYSAYGDRGTEASVSIAACRQGMLDAARRDGAYDAEIGDIRSVIDTRFGQIVRADIRIDYRDGSRTKPVTCEIENGLLVSARSEY